MDKYEIKEKLRMVPGSYDDFVYETAFWMEKDDIIRKNNGTVKV